MNANLHGAAMLIGYLFACACAGTPKTAPSPSSAEASTDDSPPPGQPPPGDSDGTSRRTPQTKALEDTASAPESMQNVPSEPQWVKNTAPETEADSRSAIPPGLLKDNIKTTHYTALVQITEGRVDDPNPGFGYVNHIYRAKVLETFRGEVLETIEYRVMADRGLSLFLPGYPVIVSLCDNGEKGFYVPDNGYVSAAVTSLQKIARRVGKKVKKSGAASACAFDE